LLLAALDADATLATIRTAARSAASGHADVDDLDPARRADLVRVDAHEGRLVFRHPLIRSAIVQASSPGERRSAHQALAAALAGDPARRAWHLAEAATGPDEAVARALEESALSAWRRSGASAAVTLLVRAGELSPRPADRSRRLIEAAYIASSTGPLDRVTRLLADARQADDARQASGTPSGSVFAAAAAVYLAQGEGDIDAAHRLLARALDDADTNNANSDWVNDILYALLFVCAYGDRPELWEVLGSALARFDPEETTALRLCYDALADPAGASYPVRERLARAFDALSTDAAPRQIIPLAYAALRVDMLSEYRHLFRRMIERERDGGAIAMVISGLFLLSADSYRRGQWDEAETLAREGLDLAATHGYHLLEGQLRGHVALIAAARGKVDLARTISNEITTWATPRSSSCTAGLDRGGVGDHHARRSPSTPVAPVGDRPALPGPTPTGAAPIVRGRQTARRPHRSAATPDHGRPRPDNPVPTRTDRTVIFVRRAASSMAELRTFNDQQCGLRAADGHRHDALELGIYEFRSCRHCPPWTQGAPGLLVRHGRIKDYFSRPVQMRERAAGRTDGGEPSGQLSDQLAALTTADEGVHVHNAKVGCSRSTTITATT
jgi:hypothetical protein